VVGVLLKELAEPAHTLSGAMHSNASPRLNGSGFALHDWSGRDVPAFRNLCNGALGTGTPWMRWARGPVEIARTTDGKPVYAPGTDHSPTETVKMGGADA
jgi:hypothetical protein